jgi:hypothetical protein
MRSPTLIFATILLASAARPIEARAIRALTYQELFDQSTLVVVASPINQTTDTQEQYVMPGLTSRSPDGTTVNGDKCIGVETAFRISAVLKGADRTRELILHHYREVTLSVNGPMFVRFDASLNSYLLFLVREPDGRYAPAGGQVDPGFSAITKLPRVDPGVHGLK